MMYIGCAICKLAWLLILAAVYSVVVWLFGWGSLPAKTH